jgi:hypothetical protein
VYGAGQIAAGVDLADARAGGGARQQAIANAFRETQNALAQGAAGGAAGQRGASASSPGGSS